jgi:hypothetical protein
LRLQFAARASDAADLRVVPAYKAPLGSPSGLRTAFTQFPGRVCSPL